MKRASIIYIAGLALFCGAFGIYSIVHADIFGSSLIAWWRLDTNTITQNISDSSGNGYTGDIVGGVATSSQAGILGQALFCDANTEVFVPVINLSTLTQDTFSFWVKPNTTVTSASGEKDIMWINDTPAKTTEYFFIIWPGDGNIEIDHKLDAQGDQLTETTGITSWTGGKWYFITVVSGSAGVSLYVNGVLNNTAVGNTRSINSMATPTTMTLTFADGRFGGNQGTGNVSTMDDVKVYNRNLSAAEVQQAYYQGLGQHSN